MKLKKLFAVVITMVMMVGITGFFPSASEQSGGVLSALKSLSLDAEPFTATAASTGTLRRPVSSEQPMWIVHIDSWNYADPQKIIDLIPEDILPYVVFNISLSINWDSTANEWKLVQYGYETAKSWLRTCADNQVWAMIQPASGGQSHFPDYNSSTDYENTIYAEFYRDYPNFIGFNYCEQFWGFDQEDFPISAVERYEHFAKLLELSNKYGGYLVVSWCANQWSPNINPVAMLKRVPNFEAACSNYTENYILLEKYTSKSYKFDMESVVLGAYLSGYAGNYGIRYDESGWTDSTGVNQDYTLATGLSAHLERLLLSGMTVIDGPELIWLDCFKELSTGTTSDGYSTRRWDMYNQFQNIMVDVFRKVLDGTVRIPTREEVIDRTKVVIVNDVSSGTDDDKYSSPTTLFEGLYRMDSDGNLKDNKSFFKKTGRYPTIPTVYALDDSLAQSFEVQIKKSTYSTRWPTIDAKVSEMNTLFEQEYTGDIYAGRNENTWVVYNPYKTNQTASGSIPFKYNTAASMDVTLTRYGAGIINEYADSLNVYLNNYDDSVDTSLKTDTIKIYSSSSQPTFTYEDRGVNQTASVVTSDWSNGVFTLTVKHNGPIDITINCSGTASNRLTSYTQAKLTPPDGPSFYTGPRQFEAEHFDYKNIEGNVTSGAQKGINNYTGQGYMKFGTNANAAVKDTVTTTKSGTFTFKLKYAVTSAASGLELYVNGVKTASPTLSQTSSLSDWAVYEQSISLNAGQNTIELKATSTLASSLYLDNFIVEGDFGSDVEEVIEPDENGYYFHDEFESTDYDWEARGSVTLGLSGRTPYMGANALLVSERTDAWNGALKNLDDNPFNPGTAYAFSACVKYLEGKVTQVFYLTLQYKNGSGDTEYANIDTKTAVRGEYVQLYNANYTIPEDASDVQLVIETSSNSMNFYIDEAIGAVAGTVIDGPSEISLILGDVNRDGEINSLDIALAKNGMLSGFSTNLMQVTSDVDQNGVTDADDYKLLKEFVLSQITEFPI